MPAGVYKRDAKVWVRLSKNIRESVRRVKEAHHMMPKWRKVNWIKK